MEELKLEIEIAKELPELSQQAVLPAKNESITYFKASNQEARFDINNSFQPVIPLNERRFKRPSDRVVKKVKLEGQSIFEQRKLDQQKINEYLKFAGQFINKQKHKMDDQGFITNINHLNFEENALNFLHKMNYSTTKAKFFLLFPTLLYFNQLKPDNQLQFTEEEMEEKINQYLLELKQKQLSQHERWKQQLTELLSQEKPIPFNQLQTILDTGKNLHCEIPETAKDLYDQALKYQKNIKHFFTSKHNLHEILNFQNTFINSRIDLPEFQLLSDKINKSKLWIHKLHTINLSKSNNDNDIDQPIKKYSIKQLGNLLHEYKENILLHNDYGRLKQLYQKVQEIIKRISVGRIGRKKVQRTSARTNTNQPKQGKDLNNLNNLNDKIDITEAKEILMDIQELPITCEEFETFINSYETSQQIIENVQMWLEDGMKKDNLKMELDNLFLELNEMEFKSPVLNRLTELNYYYNTIEQIKEDLKNNSKSIFEIQKEVRELQAKGYNTQELLLLQSSVEKIQQWYIEYKSLLKKSNSLSLTDYFAYNYNEITKLLTKKINQKQLEELISSQIIQYVEPSAVEELKCIQIEVQQWKNKAAQPIISFEQLLDIVSEGYQLPVFLDEIMQLLENCQQKLKWVQISVTILKHYQSNYQSNIISNQEFAEIERLETRSEKEQLLRQEFEIMSEKQLKISDSILEETKEFTELNKLKAQSQKWIQEVFSTLNSEVFTPEIEQKIIDLNSLHTCPFDKTYKNACELVCHIVIWLGEVNSIISSIQTFTQNYENKEASQQLVLDILERNGIQQIESSLSQINCQVNGYQYIINNQINHSLINCEQQSKQFVQNEHKRLKKILEEILKECPQLQNNDVENLEFAKIANLKNLIDTGIQLNNLLSDNIDLKFTVFNYCEKQLNEKISQCKIVYSQCFEWKNEFVALLSKDKKANNKQVKNKLRKQKFIQSPSIKASKKSEEIELEANIQQSHEELIEIENDNNLNKQAQQSKLNESMEIEHTLESANKSVSGNRNSNKASKIKKQTKQQSNEGKTNEENEKLKQLLDQYNKNNILYFQKLPRLLILVYQAYQNQFTIKIHSQELQIIHEYLSNMFVFFLKCQEIFDHLRPADTKTKQDLETILEIGDNFVCYNLEYARLNSYNKAMNIWCQIADKIIQSLPNPRKYIEQLTSLILPKDLNQENTLFSYNEQTHVLKIDYIHEKLIPDWKQKCLILETSSQPESFTQYLKSYFEQQDPLCSPIKQPIFQTTEIDSLQKSNKKSIK